MQRSGHYLDKCAKLTVTFLSLFFSYLSDTFPSFHSLLALFVLLSQAGLTNQGSMQRLRAALDRYLHKGANLTVTFLGGSITAGAGQEEGLNYPM